MTIFEFRMLMSKFGNGWRVQNIAKYLNFLFTIMFDCMCLEQWNRLIKEKAK